MIFYVIGIIIVAIPILHVVFEYFEKKKLLKRFISDYIDWQNETYCFEDLTLIRKYWDKKCEFEVLPHVIDETTWNDLDMNRIFSDMDVCRSSIGSEYLYAKLRVVNFNEHELEKFSETVDFMNDNADIKAHILYSLHSLGKELYNGVYSYIYEINEKPIRDIYIYYMLALIFITCVTICFFTPVAVIPAIISFTINIAVYYRNKFRLEVNFNSLAYISKMTKCAYELSKIDLGKSGYDEDFKAALRSLGKYSRLSSSLSIASRASTELEFLLEYVKMAVMWDFINYNRAINNLLKHVEEFHQIYKLIGEIDCAIAICEYRKTLKFYCIPEFCKEDNVLFDDIFHPLVKEPVCNTFNWENNAIVTGSNASGKSTFIKALAVTIICAQSLHMCFARRYKGKMSQVATSMAVKDKLYAGESYFIAEIKSLKRIVENSGMEIRLVCFIDEILKGTNTIERIASSAALLNLLAEKNCMVMVASHDIELTEILSRTYNNFHFEEQVKENGVFFDYILHTEPARTRNAIKLLSLMGFDHQVTEFAFKLAENYEKSGKWWIC